MSYSVPPMLTLPSGIDILFEKSTPETGVELEKHPLHYASGDGNLMQSLPYFLISLLMTCFLIS